MKHFKKSTPKEIQQYKYLYQAGWSYNKIGKKFNKDHTTIMWHIEKAGLRKPTMFKKYKKKPKKKQMVEQNQMVEMPVLKKSALIGKFYKDKDKAIKEVNERHRKYHKDDYLILAKKEGYLIVDRKQFEACV